MHMFFGCLSITAARRHWLADIGPCHLISATEPDQVHDIDADVDVDCAVYIWSVLDLAALLEQYKPAY
jgi:hypothetical protein